MRARVISCVDEQQSACELQDQSICRGSAGNNQSRGQTCDRELAHQHPNQEHVPADEQQSLAARQPTPLQCRQACNECIGMNHWI